MKINWCNGQWRRSGKRTDRMKLSFPPKLMDFWVSPLPLMLMYFFAGFKKNLGRVWPNSGFSCCVFLTLWITILCCTISMFMGRAGDTFNYACWMWYLGECQGKVQIWSVVAPTLRRAMRGLRKLDHIWASSISGNSESLDLTFVSCSQPSFQGP